MVKPDGHCPPPTARTPTSGPSCSEVDPANRLLASQNPRRLEAEFVRDNALAIAGLLDPEIGRPERQAVPAGGLLREHPVPRPRLRRRHRRPPVPPRPLHALAADVPAPDAGQLRRPLARGRPPAPRVVQHAPAGADAAERPDVRRGRPGAGGAGRGGLAADDGGRLDAVFGQALARPPEAGGGEVARPVPRGRPRALQGDQPDEADKLLQVGLAPVPEDVDRVELAAWTSVCRVVLNLHETITRY